ncbi:MAG TPA: CHAD domain-containing protein [Actinocrinis sp.]
MAGSPAMAAIPAQPGNEPAQSAQPGSEPTQSAQPGEPAQSAQPGREPAQPAQDPKAEPAQPRERAAGKNGGAPRPDLTAKDVLRTYLAAQSSAFLGQFPRLRDAQPEASHRIRVACRRARSMLRTFRPLLDPAWADGLAEDIAQFTDTVGPERDLEVMRDRLGLALEALEGEIPGTARARTLLDRLVHREYAAAHEATLAALAGPKFHALADRFALAPQALPFSPDADPDAPAGATLYPLVTQSFSTVERRASKLPDVRDHNPRDARAALKAAGGDEQTDEMWHRLRIAAKRCRYAAEVCIPAAGADASGFARQMTEVTEQLGSQQDAIVASALLLRAARTPRIAAPTGFVLGRLLGDCRVEVLRSRLAFPALWSQVADSGYRAWLEQ